MDDEAEEVKVNISYWFAPKELKDDLANMLLLDAFKFFYEENYRYMIISAHSSVEILQYNFFDKVLTENGVGKGKAKNFLKNAATYSYRLKTLLPFIWEVMDFPEFDSKIHEGLVNLVDDRNDLMHYGETDTTDIEKMKRELISAFFAFKYFKLFNETTFL